MKNYTDNINWLYLGRQEEAGIWVDEYIDENRQKMKQVWSDGYAEIFEIG